MNRSTVLCLVLAGASLAVPRAQAQAAGAAGTAAQLESTIRSAMKANRIVGMSAVVVSGGERLLRGGWGWEDAGRKKQVTAGSLFPVGSITKLFTATAIMQLVEKGVVDLDAPLSRYLPELAAAGRYRDGPTVRQALTHHGGITGNYMEGFEQEEPDPRAFLRLPALLADQQPAAGPGTIFAYSNTGYALLGCMVERLSGVAYAEVVQQGILAPLGMTGSRFFLSGTDAQQSVMGFEGKTARAIYPIRDIPAGALLSTAEDMERFMRFIFDGGQKVLGREAFAEMTRRQNVQVDLDGEFSIGLGYWLITPFPTDERFVSHGGDIPPFHAILVTVPARRTGVYLAANSSGAGSALVPLAVDMIRTLLAAQTGEPARAEPLPARTRPAAAVLQAIPGLYASPMGLIEVRRRGERILARVQGAPVELVARADGTFTLELSILGLVSIPLRRLAPLRMVFESHAGRPYLRISALGVMAGVAERYEPQGVTAGWEARAGGWTRIALDANADTTWPAGVTLRADRRRGLLLSYRSPGMRGTFPLEVLDSTRAVIRGKGTGLGETITVREEGGTTILEWSGMRFGRR